MSRVFGIGTVLVDHVVEFDRFPEIDTKNPVQRQWQQLGGPVPVALSTASFYRVETTFLGRWGDDLGGHFLQSVLTSRGIQTCHPQSQPEWTTGFAHVWNETENGTRTIAYSRGDFPPLTSSEVPIGLLQEHSVLHLDGTSPDAAIGAAQVIRNQGGTVVLDAGSVKPGMEELLPSVDLLIASASFRQSRFGSAAVPLEEIVDLGVGAVIATNGSADAVYFDGVTRHVQPSVPVKTVDSTGAGDVFTGAILRAITQGWPVERSMKFAAGVAAWSCARRGNSNWPTLEELAELEA